VLLQSSKQASKQAGKQASQPASQQAGRKNKQQTHKQETPQCDETRFLTIQPSIYVTGIRNERWQ